jgi:trehalose-6-phosphate synthase
MLRDRNVYVSVFLIGIESQKFVQGMEKPEVQVRIAAPAQYRRDKKSFLVLTDSATPKAFLLNPTH